MIATYNPDEKKLLVTLNSAIIQKDVDLQIVVSDDGSKNFNPIKIIEYCEEKQFHNYVITALDTNQGTVKNVGNGLNHCTGKYVKAISPGDYLYGVDVLSRWIRNIEENKAVISFADCIHYHYEDGEIVATVVRANPQKTSGFYKNSWAYNYLIFDDIATGVCMLTDTKKLKEYNDLIIGKVTYADDNVYRLMAMNEETACYYNADVVLYEHGTGISTSGSAGWNKKVSYDWFVTDEILLEEKRKTLLYDNFRKKIECRNERNSLIRKIKNLRIRGNFFYIIREKFIKRYTSDFIDGNYVDFIHKL